MGDIYDFDQEQGGGDGGQYDDFYLKLRAKVEDFAAKNPGGEILDMVLNIPDFFYLLVKLARDPDVPASNKRQIILALAYFLSPLDVVPDFLPGLGWLDDLYVALIVTDNLLNAVGDEVIMRYWPGDDNVVMLIKSTMDRLNEKLGAGAIRRILDKFKAGDAQ